MSFSFLVFANNTCPHIAWQTKDLSHEFTRDIFDHLPYSLDLVPSDFHLFIHMKKWLGSQIFEDNELQDDKIPGGRIL